MRLRQYAIIACVALVAVTSPATAQNTREDLIGRARAEFSDTASLRLLLSALDPARGAPDSLWAVAGYDLASVLLRTDQEPLASTWLRWLTRHASAWPMDRIQYPPAVVQAYDQAVADTRGTTDSVRTSWQWPQRFDPTAPGTVRAVSTDPSTIFALSAEGRDEPAARTLGLPPGTYTLDVIARDYEPIRVTREILPGVTTILEVDPVPLLPTAAQSVAAASLVRITFDRNGEQVCRNGLLASDDGLVLTTLGALQGADHLQVAAATDPESFRPVSVVATDRARDLAVLRLPLQRLPAPVPATGMRSRDYAWSVHFDGCGARTATRTRLADWPAAPTVPVALASPVPLAATGAPLVDRSGRLIGLVMGSSTVLPIQLTTDLVERARHQPVAQARGRRRFPFLWVGAGLAAAGITYALVSGGGGGSSTSPPTTGGIVITFPN